MSAIAFLLSFSAFWSSARLEMEETGADEPAGAEQATPETSPRGADNTLSLFAPALYRSAQLLLLHGEAEARGQETKIYIAQILAVMVVGSTVGLTLVKIFEKNVRFGWIRLRGGHVVVCGLSANGLNLVKEFALGRKQTIAVENRVDNENVADAEERGAIVLSEDPAALRTLRSALADRAKYLIAISDDDGVNVEIAVKTARVIEESKHTAASPVKCFVHIVDLQLRALFAQHRLLSAGNARMRTKIFNVFENSARLLLASHPPDPFSFGATDPKAIHLIIFGFGQMGQSVAVQAAKLGHFANGKKLRITVIDKDAGAKQRNFEYHYPFFGDVCDIAFLEWDAEDLGNLQKAGELARADGAYSTCAICFDSDTRSLSFALKLLKCVPSHVAVRVRMRSSGGFASLLSEHGRERNISGQLTAFGAVSDACTPEMVVNEHLDALARVIHEDFVAKRKMERQRADDDPSMASWESLNEVFVDSNRQQADHIDVKLRAIACYRGKECIGNPVEFTVDEIEILAKMEHARWNAERQFSGWSYAPGKKDVDKKTSPYIVPWDALPEEVKGWDREAVRNISRLLKSSQEYVFR